MFLTHGTALGLGTNFLGVYCIQISRLIYKYMKEMDIASLVTEGSTEYLRIIGSSLIQRLFL